MSLRHVPASRHIPVSYPCVTSLSLPNVTSLRHVLRHVFASCPCTYITSFLQLSGWCFCVVSLRHAHTSTSRTCAIPLRFDLRHVTCDVTCDVLRHVLRHAHTSTSRTCAIPLHFDVRHVLRHAHTSTSRTCAIPLHFDVRHVLCHAHTSTSRTCAIPLRLTCVTSRVTSSHDVLHGVSRLFLFTLVVVLTGPDLIHESAALIPKKTMNSLKGLNSC